MDDEYFYELVATELKAGQRKDGLWLKALTEAEGKGDKAEALYVKNRVAQLIEEAKPKTEDCA